MAALIKRPESQRKMREQGSIQKRRPRRIAPQGQKPNSTVVHRVERDQSERMVEQMRRQIGEQDQTGGQARAADIHIGVANLLRLRVPPSMLPDRMVVRLISHFVRDDNAFSCHSEQSEESFSIIRLLQLK